MAIRPPHGYDCLRAVLPDGREMVLDDYIEAGDRVEFREEFDDPQSRWIGIWTADHYDAVRDVWVMRDAI